MSRGEDLLTAALSGWLITGLFLDGWAHNTQPQLETFVTPWHAVFYSGFAAVAVWIAWSVGRRRAPGGRWWPAVPVGYRGAVAGLAVFHVAGAGDVAWHTAFGIEHNEAALLSPTHLGLYLGAFLVVTAPLRSRWADPTVGRRAGWRELAPVVVSLALTADLSAFILQNFSPVRDNPVSRSLGQQLAATPLPGLTDRSIEHLVASFILTTVFLVAPVLFLVRRWEPPVGAVAALIGSQCVLMQGLSGFADPGLALLGVTGGALVELATRRLRPAPGRLAELRVWAALAPGLFWAVWLGGIALHDDGLGFKAEIWGGALVWTALTGVALTIVMYPPPLPARPEPEEAARGR